MDEAPDIHHIFPEAYCIKMSYKREKWNSIINKTPLLPESNRQIGGEAPSAYSKRMMRKAEIDEIEWRNRVTSHLIDFDSFIVDDFDGYFIARAKALLKSIETAMGKTIADKGSEQTINAYGCSLEEVPQEQSPSPQEEHVVSEAVGDADLIKGFHRAMIDIYTTAKRECGYNASRFLQMINEKGGLATAKQLISKPGGTDGFTILWEHHRLDLSVEATVLKPEFRALFTDEEQKLCRDRLEQFGYSVK